MNPRNHLAALLLALAISPSCSAEDPPDAVAEASAVHPPLEQAAPATASADINPRLLRRFRPLTPPASPTDPSEMGRIALGRQLFFDPVLSADGDLSCNSCHPLDHYGADGSRTSIGRFGAHGTRNAPTVLNASLQFAQFWDGRSATVEAQAAVPITATNEMGLSKEAAVSRVRRISGYVSEFKAAFPSDAEPVSFEHITVALGAFERTLVFPGRWDRYLEGDKSALSPHEADGLRVFLNSGCMVCHTGALLGGSMFERVGAVVPWPDTSDTGRMGVTGAAADKMMFKVPSLRNVEKTAPYFHDGSAPTLEIAVKMMGEHQLGIDLEPAEVDAIVAWLKALTGDVPDEIGRPPPLPVSGDHRPLPQAAPRHSG